MKQQWLGHIQGKGLYGMVLVLLVSWGALAEAGMNAKVEQLDIDHATLEDVWQVFGVPLEYRWGQRIIDLNEIPARNYCMVYPDQFMIWMQRDQVVELRFESPDIDYQWQGSLAVGMPLDDVLKEIGAPRKTIQGQANEFVDGVLYRDIKGRIGHGYYARADLNLRLWFGNDHLAAIYVTRGDYGQRHGAKPRLTLDDLPETSFINEDGRIVDKVDYPFVDDPNAMGHWISVDFVDEIDAFVPLPNQSDSELFLKELYLRPGGKTNWAFTWTQGLILHHGDKTASRYLIKTIEGQDYLFFEWKSGDYTLRHQKPSYYVLRRGEVRPYVESRVIDRTDYPFVDDPAVIGTWNSVDFVDCPSQFNPDERSWQGGELFLKELTFLPDGMMAHESDTWTQGLVLDHHMKTASRYLIKQSNGETYLFYEWKSGDYVYRKMTPKYYVLKKAQ